MRRRCTIEKMVADRFAKIEKLKSEIIELNREAILLSDKTQQFIEKEEEILICGRPKKYETMMMGRIYWEEDFIDEDSGEVVTINRSQAVRINGEWQ